jgi:hypothetical protein
MYTIIKTTIKKLIIQKKGYQVINNNNQKKIGKTNK